MQVNKSRRTGDILVQFGDDATWISFRLAARFLDECDVSSSDRVALDLGSSIQINRPYNLVEVIRD